MSKRFKVGLVNGTGVAAIWEGAGDTLPFTDPYGNADRVKFSTTFNYTRIIDRRVINVVLPEAKNKDERRGTIALFAHGRGGVPRVRGNVTLNGQNISLGCHIPIQTRFDTYESKYSFRLAVLGATSTDVVLMWYANMLGFGDDGTILPQITIPITVEVTNEIIG